MVQSSIYVGKDHFRALRASQAWSKIMKLFWMVCVIPFFILFLVGLMALAIFVFGSFKVDSAIRDTLNVSQTLTEPSADEIKALLMARTPPPFFGNFEPNVKIIYVSDKKFARLNLQYHGQVPLPIFDKLPLSSSATTQIQLRP